MSTNLLYVVCWQLEDIIKFGLDRLFHADDSSVEIKDFTAMLGPTVDGQWQLTDSTPQTSTVSLFTYLQSCLLVCLALIITFEVCLSDSRT